MFLARYGFYLLVAQTVFAGSQSVSWPLEFEANSGQFAPAVLYLARSSSHFVYLTRDAITLGLTHSGRPDDWLRLTLAAASPNATVSAEDRTAGISNYLIGNDPRRWRRGVSHYRNVRYTGVWPGIDLLLHAGEQSLEYDFIVSPGSDPSRIRLRHDHASSLRLDANGDLILETASGQVRQHRPVIYQPSLGARRPVPGGYRILNGREIAFQIDRYDPRLPLIIDPVLTYSSYLAGTGTAALNAMTVDAGGNIYLTGRASSPDFPLSIAQTSSGSGLYRTQNAGITWATTGPGVGPSKVTALTADPKNNAVIYAGASRGIFKSADGGLNWKPASGLPNDAVAAIAVDPSNTNTVYACMSEGLYQSADAGNTWKSIVAGPVISVAVAATKPGLVYAGRPSAPILRSTDGGASWQEVGSAVSPAALAVDPSNSFTIYAGTSRSGIYLSTDGGNTWTFSNTGMVAGATPVNVNALAIDPRIPQRLYAATSIGLFRSSDGGTLWTPVPGAIGTLNVLALAINPQDANFVYAGTAGAGVYRSSDGGNTWTATGPANLDANAVAVDATGSFVHAGLFVGTQGFVTKLSPGANSLVYSTYIGGAGLSDGRAIALDTAGHAYVCGATDAPDFPTRNAYQPAIGGSRDAFFFRLNAAGSDFDYASFFGGRGDDVCEAIALDSSGNVYLAGNTYTTAAGPSGNSLPTTSGAFQFASPGGGQDCFAAKFDDSGHRLTYSTYLGGGANDACFALAVDRSGYAYLSGTTRSANFPLLQPSLGGTISSPPGLSFLSSFLARLNPDGAALSYSSLLGGMQGDTEVDGIALDSTGRVYLTGYTKATDFPFTANALSTVVSKNGKTIVVVVDPNFNRLVYSSALPGGGPDAGWRVQPDVFGNAWVIGTSYSNQFPVTSDALPHPQTSDPAPYLAEIDVGASKLLHATLLAGTAGGTGRALSVSTDGTVFAAGSTLSTDFPLQGSPFQTAKTNDYAIFLQHLDFRQTVPPPPAVSPTIASVVNAASFAANSLSPGAGITILGTNLADATAQYSSLPPTTLGGAVVSINGESIPLFYVSPTQINGQIPFDVPSGSLTLTVTATLGSNTASANAPVVISTVAPGIFLIGTNRAAATNPDNSVNTSNNPATPGDVVTVYFTGIGPLDNPVPTGQPAPLTGSLSRATLPVSATIGGQDAAVVFAGLTPGSITLAQANLVVPNLSPGDYPVVVRIGSATSNAPILSVK